MSAQSADDLWIGSVRRYYERQRKEHRARWYSFHMDMSELHARLSQEHAQKAEALCRDDTDLTRVRKGDGGTLLASSPASMSTNRGGTKRSEKLQSP